MWFLLPELNVGYIATSSKAQVAATGTSCNGHAELLETPVASIWVRLHCLDLSEW